VTLLVALALVLLAAAVFALTSSRVLREY